MVLSQPKPATRDIILDATGGLMSRYGFRKMTMDDVAKEAGISKRTIYVYFSTKEDLGLSFLRRVVERIDVQIAQILASDMPPPEKLQAVLFLRIFERVVGLKDYSQCMDEIFNGVRSRYLAQRQEFFSADARMVANLLDEGRSAESFSFDDAMATAKVLLLATGAFVPYSLSVKEMGGVEAIERDLRRMVSLLIAGLKTNPIEKNQ